MDNDASRTQVATVRSHDARPVCVGSARALCADDDRATKVPGSAPASPMSVMAQSRNKPSPLVDNDASRTLVVTVRSHDALSVPTSSAREHVGDEVCATEVQHLSKSGLGSAPASPMSIHAQTGHLNALITHSSTAHGLSNESPAYPDAPNPTYSTRSTTTSSSRSSSGNHGAAISIAWRLLDESPECPLDAGVTVSPTYSTRSSSTSTSRSSSGCHGAATSTAWRSLAVSPECPPDASYVASTLASTTESAARGPRTSRCASD